MTQAVEQGVTVEVVRPEDGQRIEVGGPEEGEIVSTGTQADGPTEASKRHPLKHAWTFWFDNPNGKQKQSTWGSCIRAVYTFSTVEDFWWYVSATPFLLLWLFDFLDHISHFPYMSVC
jgi:translation initiation factor 4E